MTGYNPAVNFVVSMVTALWGPVLGGFFLVYHYELPFWKMLAAVLIVVSILNFFGLLTLEHTKQDRPFTIISFVFMILIMMAMVMVEWLEDQFRWFEPTWFYPLVTVYLVFLTLAIFRERASLLKFYLSLNGLVLAVCWGGLLERKLSFLNF